MEQELIEANVIKLEDEKDYVIIAAIETENNRYLFLANKNEEFDVCIRKIISKENKEYLVKLDSEEEFDEVMEKYTEKYGKKEVYDEK